MFYSSLTDLFGGVPYYDESTNVNEEFMNLWNEPRSKPRRGTCSYFRRFDEAIKYLPVEHAASEYGRATKVLPMPFVEKCIFKTQKGSLPSTILKKSVYNKSNNYGYALEYDYACVFKLYNGAKSPETAFYPEQEWCSELSMVCRYRL